MTPVAVTSVLSALSVPRRSGTPTTMTSACGTRWRKIDSASCQAGVRTSRQLPANTPTGFPFSPLTELM